MPQDYKPRQFKNRLILPKENESASKLLAKQWPGFGQDSILRGKKNYKIHTCQILIMCLDWSLAALWLFGIIGTLFTWGLLI